MIGTNDLSDQRLINIGIINVCIFWWLPREAVLEYVDQVDKLGKTMAELISESLGLERSYLKEMNCVDGISMATHYYPPCPEPKLTYGICAHTDPSVMTILLQDQVGGLQVFHKDAWVDVTPVHGALVVNIGDLLQVIYIDTLFLVYICFSSFLSTWLFVVSMLSS